MIDRDHELSITRQAELLELSRASVYYLPRPVSEADLELMRRIDAMHLEHPFMGARMLRDSLRREGFAVGRKHVGTLMARMGVEPLYRRPRTTRKHPAHPVYPYLLRGLAIERANQVWAMDITYIPMARGFVYLAAVVDWASRRVLAHRVSISMDTDFCVQALEEALARYGCPEIFNTDQGSRIHQQCLHRGPRQAWHPHQHGRQGRLARQRVRRATVAKREVRGGLSARLRLGERGAGRSCEVPRVLQYTAPAQESGRKDSG